MQFSHLANRKRFASALIVLEIIIFVLYSVFVRHQLQNDPSLNPTYYPLYQDINVMMLIGFGFLMTFIRRYAWSALSYTFFINAFAVQFYILVASFWERVFHGWHDKFIYIN
jgi:ammonium transporter Rh